jgi:predicted dithiol-disulfide oxidoreductase (DUF899 family)
MVVVGSNQSNSGKPKTHASGLKRSFKMSQNETPRPKIVSQDEWLVERRKLLGQEKKLTKHLDRVNAGRRRLPMVKLTKEYLFDSPAGKQSLLDLFQGQRQLVVYHFMFDPAWEEGCSGCTGYVDALGNLSMLATGDTTFALVSRAPLARLEAYKAHRGWKVPWHSSFGSDFNYDFHVTLDPKIAPVEYNYRDSTEMERNGSDPSTIEGEEHGLSVFFHAGGDLFHTYSAYARGTEGITNAYDILDITPYGRQEDFEDSPPGWPQHSTYG